MVGPLRRAFSRSSGRPEPHGPEAPGVGASNTTDGHLDPQVDPTAAALEASPLFDEEWYRLVTGARGARSALVRHYLRTPVQRRPSPQPLFDADCFSQAYEPGVGEEDPFLLYVRDRAWATPTHPLLDTAALLERRPDAAEHPHGPIGVLLEEQAEHAEQGGRTVPAEWPEHGVGVAAGDLRGWVVARAGERRQRQAEIANPTARRKAVRTAGPVEDAGSVSHLTVDVVLSPGADEETLRRSLASLRAQTHRTWHVWVADRDWGFDLTAVLTDCLAEDAFTVVERPVGPPVTPDPAVVGAGTGEWLAFLAAGDMWAADRLARLLLAAVEAGHRALSDVMVRVGTDGTRSLSRTGLVDGQPTRCQAMPLARVLVARSAYAELAVEGRLAVELPGGHAFALTRALAATEPIEVVPAVGLTRESSAHAAAAVVPPEHQPPVDHGSLRVWNEAVLNELLVDWSYETTRERATDVVSVVISCPGDWRPVARAVAALVGSREEAARAGMQLEVVVVDNGAPLASSLVLETLAERYDDVTVVRLDGALGHSLARNLAVPAVRGATTVLVAADVVVTPGWLPPLLDALADPHVLGAQALAVNPHGPVQDGGIVFPVGGGLPYRFLAGHHVDDAAGVGAQPFRAASTACLAVRTADLVAVRGLAAVLSGGTADADLGLRAAALRPGHFVVRPDAVVHQHAPYSPASFPGTDQSRLLFLERWRGRLPQDDVEAWRSVGLRVVRQQPLPIGGGDRSLAVCLPVLERARVSEPLPRLRWALKNPAPAGPLGERWGDTHFAESLAAALRGAGQDVVVDRRHAFERPSGELDDVTLVLRGLHEYVPSPDSVSLAWVISHPDLVSGPEARRFDRVLAASVTWSEQQTLRWGRTVEPLLQATDASRFHPDLAEPDTGHGVLFIGNSRQQDRPMVVGAARAGLPLAVFGSEWEGRVDERLVHGTFLSNAEVGAAYRAAGVVLNDHWEEMREAGFVSNRLFDAAAAGARVVTDDVSGLGDLFGRSVQVAHSAEDLVRLCTLEDPDAVFGTDEERRGVAERVRSEHSFDARARRLVEVALEVRRERGLGR